MLHGIKYTSLITVNWLGLLRTKDQAAEEDTTEDHSKDLSTTESQQL